MALALRHFSQISSVVMLTWILNTSLLLLPDSFKLLFYLFKTLQTFYFFKVLHFKTLQTFYFLKYSTSFNSSSMVLIHQTCRPKPTLGSETISENWKLFKMMKNAFLFHVKSSFLSWNVTFLSWHFGYV